MNEFFSNLSQEALNRVKSPIIGTFVLCWLAYNYVWVAELVLAKDNAARLMHIKTSSISLESGVVVPLIMVLIYTFVIPLFQWLLDELKFNLIDHPRLKTHHGNEAKKYRSQAAVSRWKNIASDEYWQELHKNHAENAGRQIIALKERISFIYSDIRKGEDRVRDAEKNYNMLESNNKKIGTELQESRNTVQSLKTDVEGLLTEMGRISAVLYQNLKVIEELNWPSDSDSKSKDKNLLAQITELKEQILTSNSLSVSAVGDVSMEHFVKSLASLEGNIAQHLAENQWDRDDTQKALSNIALSLSDVVQKMPVGPLKGLGLGSGVMEAIGND